MRDTVIKVEDLGKKYLLGGSHSLSFADMVRSFIRKDQQENQEEFWALKNIGFEIHAGEAVGIIGKNGAGKSTLLKILSKITYPTEGRFEMDGRVSSLLEVGTGFHPELSGRENIFLNGTILGMRRQEIKNKFEEIVEFSGVSKFIDTPVKHYSSGMYVRLAFSVAAHLEPEILIIDEVLAVGDAEFQKKCIGKMDEVTHQGRTVLFVSHNMNAVKTLCSRAVLLQKGGVALEGEVREVVSKYLGNAQDIPNFADLKSWELQSIILEEVGILAEGKSIKEPIVRDDGIIFFLRYNYLESIYDRLDVTIHFKNHEGDAVFITGSGFDGSAFGGLELGRNILEMKIPRKFFNEGQFSLDVYVVQNRKASIVHLNDILSFRIQPEKRDINVFQGREKGYLQPLFDWTSRKFDK